MELKNLSLIYQTGGRKFRQDIPLDFQSKELLQNLPGGLSLDIRLTEVQSGKRLTVRLTSEMSAVFDRISLTARHPFRKSDKIFFNGYQSWSISQEVSASGRSPGLNPVFTPFIKKFHLKHYGDYFFQKYSARRGRFLSYTYTTIRGEETPGMLIGSLSEKSGFTVFRYHTRRNLLHIEKDCEGMEFSGNKIIYDIVILESEANNLYDQYSALMNFSRKLPPRAAGWTSWYYYYEKIDEKIILDNLKAFSERKIPIDIFQIDDGYQKAVGDWLETNSKFPRGMKPVAKAVRDAGYKPGLWLAPFIAEQKSDIVRDNPDWLLRDQKGNPVIAGNNPFNWSGYFYALDIYNPEVRDYLRRVFDTVLGDWGFEMVKLDFLYAPALLPQKGKPRGQVITEGMEFLREAAGDKMILGCGMPLGAGFGAADYCRIGSDVALSWEGEQYKILGIQTKLSLRHFRFRERVSVYNSLMSTIGRWGLNGRIFMNDPDVFILRTPYQWLTPEEKKTLFLLNQLFGGLVFTSDNISEYTPDEMNLYLRQFPFREKEIISCEMDGGVLCVCFRIGSLDYFLVSNMSEIHADISLDGEYSKGLELLLSPRFTLIPHETRVFLKPAPGDYAILGSDCHIFPGSEIERIDTSLQKIKVKRSKQNKVDGVLLLRQPAGKGVIRINTKDL